MCACVYGFGQTLELNQYDCIQFYFNIFVVVIIIIIIIIIIILYYYYIILYYIILYYIILYYIILLLLLLLLLGRHGVTFEYMNNKPRQLNDTAYVLNLISETSSLFSRRQSLADRQIHIYVTFHVFWHQSQTPECYIVNRCSELVE